jgi:hypothetical protein
MRGKPRQKPPVRKAKSSPQKSNQSAQGAYAIRALPDLCFGIVSERLGHLIPGRVSWTQFLESPGAPGAFFYSLCIGGYRTRRQVRRWSVGHDAPSQSRVVASPGPSCLISCSHWLPEGSLSVLVGRHGAMKPAGRMRTRNIMPIARPSIP